MAQEKRALLVTFEPDGLQDTSELRELFATSYDRFFNMEAVEFKCWWVDQDQGQWGAFYVFRSEQEVRDYLASDTWLKVVPKKYGCVPKAQVLETGTIISKKIIGEHQGSWLSD